MENAPGLETPLILSDTGNALAMSPVLCVQSRLGEFTLPALVHRGARGNFIVSGLVSSLRPSPLPQAVPTKIRSANGHHMGCDTYVVVLAVLGSLRFRINLLVVCGCYFWNSIFAVF